MEDLVIIDKIKKAIKTAASWNPRNIPVAWSKYATSPPVKMVRGTQRNNVPRRIRGRERRTKMTITQPAAVCRNGGDQIRRISSLTQRIKRTGSGRSILEKAAIFILALSREAVRTLIQSTKR